MTTPLHEHLVNEYSLLKDCRLLEEQTKRIAKETMIEDKPFDVQEMEELDVYYGLTRAAILWQRQTKGTYMSPLEQAMYRKLWEMITFVKEILDPLQTAMNALLEIDKRFSNSHEPEDDAPKTPNK